MKKIYALGLLFSIVLLPGCSKDFLKKYEDRIIGSWQITDVNRIGLGGNTNSLAFTSGRFTFYENGSLDYTDASNISYHGNWEIVKKVYEDQTVRSLQITAIDFTNQRVLAEYYDDMNFVGTNHFKAKIISGFHTYVTHFRR